MPQEKWCLDSTQARTHLSFIYVLGFLVAGLVAHKSAIGNTTCRVVDLVIILGFAG